MKQVFSPDDFANTHKNGDDIYVAYSNMVNKRLNEIIESWPVVWFSNNKTISPYYEASSRQDKAHTHTARLAFIEEIKREPCMHTVSFKGLKTSLSVDRFDNRFSTVTSVCMDCGKELKATWSEV